MSITSYILSCIIAIMELFGRVFLAVILFATVAVCFVRLGGYSSEEVKEWYPINSGRINRKSWSEKEWRKMICCRRGKKMFSKIRPNGDAGVAEFPLSFLLLMLSGNVESNLGPVGPSPGSGNGDATSGDGGMQRLEMLVTTEQSCIMERLDKIMSRLHSFETELKSVKEEVVEIGKRQVELAGVANCAREESLSTKCKMMDLNFAMDQQEQYSRKSSIRILGVDEEKAENCEAVCIEAIKVNLGIDICDKDIDIVHRIGRPNTGKARPILVKFLSHKPKEIIMRKRKEAKGIKIVEDLAYGIKKVFDFLNAHRRDIDLEYVWTIDGRIKYKFTGDPRPHEIRSYADYDRLINKPR